MTKTIEGVVLAYKKEGNPNKKGICSRSWRKFPDLGTDLTYFENISYFSRHDVNKYKFSMQKIKDETVKSFLKTEHI